VLELGSFVFGGVELVAAMRGAELVIPRDELVNVRES